MKIKLIAYGIAKDILANSETTYEIDDKTTIALLKERLISQYREFDRLQSLRFAVGEEYQADSYVLSENEEVVIIPPVSGG